MKLSNVQLDGLISLLENCQSISISLADPALLKELLAIANSERWQRKQWSARELQLIREAEAAGKVQVCKRADPKPVVSKFATGEDLLNALGL